TKTANEYSKYAMPVFACLNKNLLFHARIDFTSLFLEEKSAKSSAALKGSFSPRLHKNSQ
ncbi:MAG: hypothetical protein IJJ41_06870, partial [Clostridia bacterium]|nr:hypothetical protein [Clostridia bacterium]